MSCPLEFKEDDVRPLGVVCQELATNDLLDILIELSLNLNHP